MISVLFTKGRLPKDGILPYKHNPHPNQDPHPYAALAREGSEPRFFHGLEQRQVCNKAMAVGGPSCDRSTGEVVIPVRG